ncbi:MAG TPA: TRAP transporter small permease subunit [Gammaproteobacteria bacterium]|nr:TRAP transporter small permease subunit [Gammaproteobacteria bacterium]
MPGSTLRTLSGRLDRIAELTGQAVAWLTLALVLVTFAVVVLRYAFQFGSIAMQESILYLHASVFMLGAAYTLRQDGHVRVDIFYRDFSPRNKALVDLLGALFLLLPVCLFLLWSSREYVANAWSLREGSGETGGLPYVYLLKTLIPLAAFLLVVQGISQALASLGTLLGARGENQP